VCLTASVVILVPFAQPTYLGEGDIHDHAYDNLVRRIPFYAPTDNTTPEASGEGTIADCHYSFDMYASKTFQQGYDSNIATIATVVVGVTFAIVAFIFAIYDVWYVFEALYTCPCFVFSPCTVFLNSHKQLVSFSL